MCVPIFMVVSLVFYTQKRAADKRYFVKRISRLVQIICFWWPVYFILTQVTDFPLVPNSFFGILLIPFLNGSLYFLGGMLFCILIVEVIEYVCSVVQPKHHVKVLFTAVTLGFLLSFAVRYCIPLRSEVLKQAVGLGPLTFLMYPASLAIFAHCPKKKAWSILLMVSSIFQIVETGHLLSITGGYHDIFNVLLINYGSSVVVPAAVGVTQLFMSIKIEKLGNILSWVSKNVLGIYLVHPIVIACGNRITNGAFLYIGAKTFQIGGGTLAVNLFGVIFVVVSSFAIVYVLERSPLKRFVS